MNSTTKGITYADLERTLAQIGFAAERPNHAYQLWRHAAPDVLIVLPPREGADTVDAAHLLAVRTHVVGSGLLDDAAFDALLRGIEPTAASH